MSPLAYATATAAQVIEALAFGRAHRQSSLLVYCFHGVGRPIAAALALLADRLGPGHEVEAVEALMLLRPDATPNLIVVAPADDLLGRNGALVEALAQYEAVRPGKLAARERRQRYAVENPSLYARTG